ncbi:hypothetical protein OG994_16590 [Micromonospora globbae]|uniref:Uncharacterized protein n=1 Tax=Micromonospora globbae TaxID=1894969 RepID=A0ABZ1S0K1_9ACTN|nr:hypothetical protein [Micromonospora globbae]
MQPGHPQPVPSTPDQQARAGLFRAGQVALWVWIVLSLIPILLILACCGLCGFGSVIGAVTPTPSPSY